MRASRRWLLMMGCVLLLGGVAAAQGLTVAAAADLQGVLPGIAAQFEKTTGQRVTLTFGSSGNFFTQIQNGAPFDVFLSADVDYPRRLEASGQTAPGTLVAYARGRLVLWTRRDSGVDIRRGLAVLKDGNVRRVAVANPAHAPYGRAAVEALRHEGLDGPTKGKLVLGENISQAAQFAETGNADVGIIAWSLAMSPAMTRAGTYVEIPDSFHAPIEQAAVVLATSRLQAAARQFVADLSRPRRRAPSAVLRFRGSADGWTLRRTAALMR